MGWALNVQDRALKVRFGPGLSPSLNAEPWALPGLKILLSIAVKKTQTFWAFPKCRVPRLLGLGPFSKSWTLGLPKKPGLLPGPDHT